jgi:hypothetical protein
MTEKERLIKRMNDLRELIPATIKAIKDLPDIGDLYTTLDPGKLRVQLDYKPTEYLAFRRTIAKKWRYTERRFNELTGNYYVYLKHRDLEVELTLEIEFPTEFENGATCRLVEVGHKAEPIYRLECK